MKRSVLAVASVAVLSFGLFTGVASAQPVPPTITAQLCAAASVADANAILGANLTAQLPAGVRDAVNPGLLGGTLEQTRTALNCPAPDPEPTVTPPTSTVTVAPEPPVTEEPEPTTEAPETTTEAPDTTVVVPDPVLFENCDAARAAGAAPILLSQPGYRLELDADQDGTACEDAEGDSSTTVVVPPDVNVNDGDVNVDNGNDNNVGDSSDVVTAIPNGGIETGAF